MKTRTFVIAAACLGLLAIGASSAVAASPTKYNFTGTANNAVVYANGTEGVIRCEKLTIAGQVTSAGALPNEAKTGTVTSITPTKCIFVYANLPVTFSLTSPWTVAISSNNVATVSNVNLHGALTGSSEVYFDMTGATRTLPAGGWSWGKANVLAVKSSNFALVFGLARTGSGYLEAVFPITSTKAS